MERTATPRHACSQAIVHSSNHLRPCTHMLLPVHMCEWDKGPLRPSAKSSR